MPPEGGGARGGEPRRRELAAVLAVTFLVVALGVLAWTVTRGPVSWDRLVADARAYGWALDVPSLLGALALAVGALLATAFLWASLFRAAGGRTDTAGAMAAWLGSNLGRYLPGKVWQLAGIAAWLRARGDSGAAGLAVSLSLQAMSLATGGAIAVAIGGGTVFGLPTPLTAAIVAAGLLVAVHPAVIRRLTAIGGRLMREAGEPAAGDLSTGALVRAAVGWLGIWALYGIGFWLLLRGLVPAAVVGPAEATGIFTAGYVLGYVVLIAPGGVVVREGAIAGLLGASAGMALGPAAAVAIAARVWTTVAELLAFGVAALIRMRRPPVDR